MMEYIKGILASSSLEKTIIEVGGIGYRISIPLNNYTKLPKVGEPLQLFLSTVIREDSQKHYGFLTLEERDLFEVLTQISGIGPKTALSLLGHLEAYDLQLAISSSDVQSICKVPGIGKKTAERLIIEMRDKVQKNSITKISFTPSRSSQASTAQDALSALVNLGYQPALAQKAVCATLDEMDEGADLALVITASLKRL